MSKLPMLASKLKVWCIDTKIPNKKKISVKLIIRIGEKFRACCCENSHIRTLIKIYSPVAIISLFGFEKRMNLHIKERV